jgi:uncharacterized integral membrane protein
MTTSKMGKNSDLSPECQKFVNKLFAFYSKEKATKKPIVSFDRVYQKISKALGVSYTSVHILLESFISLCIIETVGAIFREYKPWIALLITQ